MVSLVDLDRSAVGILGDSPASPRTLFVLCEDARFNGHQRVHSLIQRLDVKTGKVAAGATPFGRATGGIGGLKDSEVNIVQISGEMFGAVAVVLRFQRHAEGSVEGGGSFSVSREEHDRGHLNHANESARNDPECDVRCGAADGDDQHNAGDT